MKNEEIAEFLKQLRLKHNLTQRELAEKMHVTHQAVSRWENGKSIPDIDVLRQLANLYQISIDEIVNSQLHEEEKSQPKVIALVFRYILVYMGLIICLLGASIFLQPEEVFWSHLVFTFFGLLITSFILFYLGYLKKKYTYLVITSILVLLFLIFILPVFPRYRVDQPSYFYMNHVREILFEVDLGVDTEYLPCYFGETEYAIIYNTGSADLYLFDLDHYYEVDYVTITTNDNPVQDVFLHDGQIYYSTYQEDTNVYQINRLSTNDLESSLVYSTTGLFHVSQIYSSTYLLSDEPNRSTTDIYIFQADFVFYFTRVDFEIYSMTGIMVDNEAMAIATVNQTLSTYRIVLLSTLDFTIVTEYFRDLETPATFETIILEMFGASEQEFYVQQNEEVVQFTWPENFFVYQYLNENYHRVEQYIVDSNFDIFQDFVYLNKEFVPSGAYILIPDYGNGFYAIDNEMIGHVNLVSETPDSWFLPANLRLAWAISSIFGYGLFVIIGMKPRSFGKKKNLENNPI